MPVMLALKQGDLKIGLRDGMLLIECVRASPGSSAAGGLLEALYLAG